MFTPEAKNETEISAADLVNEIMPLMKDVFEGRLYASGNTISYGLPNGQMFSVTVNEIK